VWSNVLLGAGLSLPTFNLGVVPGIAGAIVGVSMLYLGGMAINDAGDATFDRANNSTRPVAARRISAKTAAVTGGLLVAIGFATVATTGGLTGDTDFESLIAAAALTAMIFLYQIVHRRNAVAAAALMAGCRGCVPVLTALLLTDQVSPIVWWAAAGVALWTVGITCIGRGERGGEKRIPLGIIWLILAIIGIMGVGWTSPSGSLGAIGAAVLIMLAAWTPAVHSRIKAGRLTAAVCWAIAGIAVLDSSMLLAGGHVGWSAASMVLAGATLGAQRLGGGS
jgi:4-hydroxybenzoate polyprenyltransferase